MKTLLYTIFVLALLTLACTEEISISPVYSNETDWAPEITTVTSGYGRMYIDFSRPQRLELFRMVEHYILAIKKSTDSSYVPMDTSLSSYLGTYFRTDSILAVDQAYQARISVIYRDGTVRHSNEYTFHSPEIKGSILKSLPLSDHNDYQDDFPFDLTPGHGGLYGVFLHRKAVFIDTLSGEVTNISSEEYHRAHILNNGGLALTIYGPSEPVFHIDYYNSVTLEKDSSKQIPIPPVLIQNRFRYAYHVHSYFYDGSDVIYLWAIISGEHFLTKFNIKSGDFLEMSPAFDTNYSNFVLEPVGDHIWTNKTSSLYDNRLSIISFDNPGTPSEEYYSPVGGSAYFVPVGDYFWAYDIYKEALVKFLPEAAE